MEQDQYIHGYTSQEAQRLYRQAELLAPILHADSNFAPGSKILEAGCGVGAQTKIIATKNPESELTAIDISSSSLALAKAATKSAGLYNVTFLQADLHQLPFADNTFDVVIICFVIEHLAEPRLVLEELKRVLRIGGQLVAMEGDHGSTFFYPDSAAGQAVIAAQVQLQMMQGGSPNRGRSLYPLFAAAGFTQLVVAPRLLYVDGRDGGAGHAFIQETFVPMLEAVGPRVIDEGIIDSNTFQEGIQDLYHLVTVEGVFCYTFFKASGIKI